MEDDHTLHSADGMLRPLPHSASSEARRGQYDAVFKRIRLLLDEKVDLIAAMATIACELHHSFEYFHWTGFYRAPEDRVKPGGCWLEIGPYQGKHGCLRIPPGKGVCGQAAKDAKLLNVPDVNKFPGHIACASSTQSEIVVPICDSRERLVAGVLDVDSDIKAAFTEEDERGLKAVCGVLSRWLDK
ncbi:Protein YtsP [Coccomyxa sp. Obi]|nr:Protein YtsP [Coccomyxa sp. Obi]